MYVYDFQANEYSIYSNYKLARSVYTTSLDVFNSASKPSTPWISATPCRFPTPWKCRFSTPWTSHTPKTSHAPCRVTYPRVYTSPYITVYLYTAVSIKE